MVLFRSILQQTPAGPDLGGGRLRSESQGQETAELLCRRLTTRNRP